MNKNLVVLRMNSHFFVNAENILIPSIFDSQREIN